MEPSWLCGFDEYAPGGSPPLATLVREARAKEEVSCNQYLETSVGLLEGVSVCYHCLQKNNNT